MLNRHTIILDPGHGGINPLTGEYVTPGKRSLANDVDGSVFYEGVNNREFAKVWGEYLVANGYRVLYTVNDWKDVSLSQRIRLINSWPFSEKPLVVSIHSNAAASFDPIPEGTEIFTAPGETKSDQFAKAWGSAFRKEFPNQKYRYGSGPTPDDKEGKLAICIQTTCPAVLIELDFFTNKNGRARLESADFKNRTAKVLLQAIQKFEE